MSIATRFPSTTRTGRILRLPMRLVPHGRWTRILTGANKGCWWRIGSTSHSYWIGWYEPELQREFVRTIQPGMTVWDIGANVGYYALLAARLTGHDGIVLAVEPHPETMAAMSAQLDRNGITNVRQRACAIGAACGEGRLALASTNSRHRLADDGVPVQCLMLDALLDQYPAPHVLKMDIEGGEDDAFRGAARLLRDARPIIWLAVHPPRGSVATQILHDAGYTVHLIAVNLYRATPPE